MSVLQVCGLASNHTKPGASAHSILRMDETHHSRVRFDDRRNKSSRRSVGYSALKIETALSSGLSETGDTTPPREQGRWRPHPELEPSSRTQRSSRSRQRRGVNGDRRDQSRVTTTRSASIGSIEERTRFEVISRMPTRQRARNKVVTSSTSKLQRVLKSRALASSMTQVRRLRPESYSLGTVRRTSGRGTKFIRELPVLGAHGMLLHAGRNGRLTGVVPFQPCRAVPRDSNRPSGHGHGIRTRRSGSRICAESGRAGRLLGIER